LVAVVELDLELRVRQRVDDGPIHLDRVILGHARNSNGRSRSLSAQPECSVVRAPLPSDARRTLVLPIGGACRAACSPLCLEAIRAIDGLVAARLEWNARLAIAAGACRDEQLAARRRAVSTTCCVGRRTKRIRSFGLSRRSTRRTSTRRIVETATCVELLFTAGEHERCVAIAAGEGFVCVLHADSRERSGGK